MTELQKQSLALIFVLRWSHYRSLQVCGDPKGKSSEYKHLKEQAVKRAKDGLNPIPPDNEPVSLAHLLRAAIGIVQDADPTLQEAYLSVELAGRMMGFAHWRFLSRPPQPWHWWQGQTGVAGKECLGLLVMLSRALSR